MFLKIVSAFLITNIIDESRSVAMLYDFECSHSTAPIQRETLAPSWNTIWVDPFTDPHGAPVQRGQDFREL